MQIVPGNANGWSPELSNLEELTTPYADIYQAHVTLEQDEQRQGHRDAALIELMREQDQAAQP
jgi:hypothetical protein